MASLAFGPPILPGQTDPWRRLAEELQGPRRSEMARLLRRAGVTVENWYLQTTPQGTLCIVYLQVADIARAFQVCATDDEPFARWYKQQLHAIHGINFNQPLPGPIAEVMLELDIA
jgi:hypothetical protein